MAYCSTASQHKARAQNDKWYFPVTEEVTKNTAVSKLSELSCIMWVLSSAVRISSREEMSGHLLASKELIFDTTTGSNGSHLKQPCKQTHRPNIVWDYLFFRCNNCY